MVAPTLCYQPSYPCTEYIRKGWVARQLLKLVIFTLVENSGHLKVKATELQTKIENAGGEGLRKQKAKVDKIQSDIDKNGTEINRLKVQLETGEKNIKKLTKGIEDSKKERETFGGEI